MPIEAMNQSLDGGFVEVSQVGRCLPRLHAQHHCLRID